MKLLKSKQELLEERAKISKKIAFVPTMGALHQGHLELLNEAKHHGEVVFLSIFVNPTQFGPNEDLSKYPRKEAEDVEKVGNLADYIYLPRVEDIYTNGPTPTLKAGKAAEGLCGQFRPGHFDGVVSVVGELFNQVDPDVALFGEKDYQQLMVIKEMNFPVQIIGVPTVRELDGLAMSSRNAYLSPKEREIAGKLNHFMKEYHGEELKAKLEEAGFKVQYVEKRWDRLLAAVYLGNTRLIDNISLKS